MENNIIINQRYFNNIKIGIDALNTFFDSYYHTKNFPNISEDSDLDEGLRHTLVAISSIDSRWVDNSEVADEAVDKINDARSEYVKYIEANEGGSFFDFCASKNDEALSDLGNEYLSFKALTYVSDNIEDFNKLMNALYSFDLFLHPSAYKNEIEKFSQNVPVNECEDMMANTEFKVFDPVRYVQGIFENDDITLPDSFDMKAEEERFLACQDRPDVKVSVNEAIQEAAEINYFTNTKPKHIKYEGGKWVISQQFEKTVNDLVAALRKCNDSDDLKTFFENEGKKYAKDLSDTVAPFILVQGMIKKGKEIGGFTKYSDSYKSIISKNKGAKRFENYDIFTTFKADKKGTIRFIEDFLKLKLANDGKARITNNTVLTLFNIFDSRIYFDILFNFIPEKDRKEKGMDEDSFVRQKRSGLNKNSRSMNAYDDMDVDEEADNSETTSQEVKEYSYSLMRTFDDIDEEVVAMEAWHDMLREEIESVGDGLYAAQIPLSATNEYIGESFDIVNEYNTSVIMEAASEEGAAVKSVLGCLLGTGSVETMASTTVSPLTLMLFIDACGVKTSTCQDMVSSINKKSRGKNIKAEILRDINSIIRALAKDADEVDDYIIRDLKKRSNALKETVSFALKRKDTFNDTEKEFLIDLHHAATKLTNVSIDDTAKNDKLIRSLFKACENVIKMIAKVSDEDINACISTNEVEPDTENVEGDVIEQDTTDGEESDPSTDEPAATQESALVQEVEQGAIPKYMDTRIKLSDNAGKQPATVEDVEAPSDAGDTPSNPIDDLADSIDEKLNAGGDDLKDMLGKEAKKEGKNIVVNVTNNYSYNNSFNKSSNDLSTGKTINNDNSVKDQSVKDQSVKAVKDNGGSNNKYNSTDSSDTKESKKVQEFTTGYSVDDVFAFLESEEPLLEASDAKPPKEDSLTKAMDRDRKKLPKQQAAKKAADKTVSTAKAVAKPVVRTKQWLLGIVNSLVEKREENVKADIIQKPGYRTGLFKAARIALKAGLIGVAFTINVYVGGAYLLLLGSNAYDKHRIKKEVEREFATEIEILNDKIKLAERDDTPEARKAKWQMMRLRSKMEQIVTNDVVRDGVKHPNAVQ